MDAQMQETQSAQSDLHGLAPSDMAQPTFAGRTDAQRRQALTHFASIRPFFEDGVPLTRLAAEHSVGLRTLQRWVARYKKHGLVGLVRLTRGDRNSRRHMTPELQTFIEGLALQKPAPHSAAIHRRIATLAPHQGWKPVSYSTVARVVNSLDPALKTLAHEGTKAYRTRFDLLYRREATVPNELWQADHTLLDIWVRDERDHPVRPWLTVILDDYSRGRCGLCDQ